MRFLTLVFLLIALFSMFNEDTLESQPGVTFFSFFYSLLIFNQNNKSSDQVV